MGYKISASIRGTAPLLMHAFGSGTLEGLMQGAGKKTGSQNYAYEWMDTLHSTEDGLLCIPALHIEGALVNAAKLFTVKGRGKATYKDVIRAYAYVQPDKILLLWEGAQIKAPEASLLESPTDALSVNIMRVKVQSSAVARSRLQVAEGWEAAFTIDVIEDQLRSEVVQEILTEAGRSKGIGDFRPRYGRFEVTGFHEL